ncbi:MAG: hypothetical protein ACR2IK_05395 [Chloroflexota bacterium]
MSAQDPIITSRPDNSTGWSEADYLRLAVGIAFLLWLVAVVVVLFEVSVHELASEFARALDTSSLQGVRS